MFGTPKQGISLRCSCCNEPFHLTRIEVNYHIQNGLIPPKVCRKCRALARELPDSLEVANGRGEPLPLQANRK